MLSIVGALGVESDCQPDWITDEDPFLEARFKQQPSQPSPKGSFSLKRYTLSRADRIRKSSEYRALSKKGSRQHSDCFIILSRKNELSKSRLGLTVSKKVGSAVRRNKIKRIVRDYFRLNRDRLPDQTDINVIARHKTARLGAAEIRKDLGRCFEKITGKTAP